MFLTELPDTGTHGFILPASYISQVFKLAQFSILKALTKLSRTITKVDKHVFKHAPFSILTKFTKLSRTKTEVDKIPPLPGCP